MDISACRTLVKEMAETMVFMGVVEGPGHSGGREDQPPSGVKSFTYKHAQLNRDLFSAIMSAPASSSNGRVSGKPWKAQKTPAVYVVLFPSFLFAHCSVQPIAPA